MKRLKLLFIGLLPIVLIGPVSVSLDQEVHLTIYTDTILVTPHSSPADSSLVPLVGFLHSHPDSSLWDQYVKPLKPNFWRNKTYFPDYHLKGLKYNPEFHYQMSLMGQFDALGKGSKSEFWPHNEPSHWKSHRSDKMSLLEGLSKENISVDIWNEPNLPNNKYWQGTDTSFFEHFIETLNWLNTEYPQLRVAGPSTTGKTGKEFIENLLNYVMHYLANHSDTHLTLNMLSVHGMGQPYHQFLRDLIFLSNLVYSENEYDSLSIESLIYNEYLTRKESQHFSLALRKLSDFEQYGVKYAGRACWGTCQNGSLDGLLNVDGTTISPNENWYGYYFYSLVRGKRFTTRHPSSVSCISGLTENNQPIVIIGNCSEVTKAVKIDFIDTLNKYLPSNWILHKLTPHGLEYSPFNPDEPINSEPMTTYVLLPSKHVINVDLN